MKNFKTIMKYSKTTIICLVVFTSSIISFVISYYIDPHEWSWISLFFNLAIALFQLFLALIIVNVYLFNTNKRELYEAIFEVVKRDMSLYQNHIIDLLRHKFGKENFDKIIQKFTSKYDITYLSEDDRIKIIEAIKDDFSSLIEEALTCADSISQTARSGLVSSNPKFLKYDYYAFKAAKNLARLNIDNNLDIDDIVHNILLLLSINQLLLNDLKVDQQ